MRIFIMEGCPGCKAVMTKIKELKVDDKFSFVDIKGDYDGFIPDQVPVLQDEIIGTIHGENIINMLDKFYGK